MKLIYQDLCYYDKIIEIYNEILEFYPDDELLMGKAVALGKVENCEEFYED